MRAQRVRGGESRIEMQTVKWTAEGMGNGKRQVFHDVKVYVSYRRYAGISQRVWSKKIINQGGTAKWFVSPLTATLLAVKGFLLPLGLTKPLVLPGVNKEALAKEKSKKYRSSYKEKRKVRRF